MLLVCCDTFTDVSVQTSLVLVQAQSSLPSLSVANEAMVKKKTTKKPPQTIQSTTNALKSGRV